MNKKIHLLFFHGCFYPFIIYEYNIKINYELFISNIFFIFINGSFYKVFCK